MKFPPSPLTEGLQARALRGVNESPRALTRILEEEGRAVEAARVLYERTVESASERVCQRARPVLVAAFRKLPARYGVLGVFFGNGPHCIRLRPDARGAHGRSYEDMLEERWPKALRDFDNMCAALAWGFPVDDLTEKDLEP